MFQSPPTSHCIPILFRRYGLAWPQTFILSGLVVDLLDDHAIPRGLQLQAGTQLHVHLIFTKKQRKTYENLWKPMKTYGFMRKTHGKSSTKGGIKPWTMEISWVNGLFKGKSMVETMDFPIKYGEIFCTYSLKPTHWIMGFCFMTMVISYLRVVILWMEEILHHLGW